MFETGRAVISCSSCSSYSSYSVVLLSTKLNHGIRGIRRTRGIKENGEPGRLNKKGSVLRDATSRGLKKGGSDRLAGFAFDD